jgi:hypothetical protein
LGFPSYIVVRPAENAELVALWSTILLASKAFTSQNILTDVSNAKALRPEGAVGVV